MKIMRKVNAMLIKMMELRIVLFGDHHGGPVSKRLGYVCVIEFGHCSDRKHQSASN